MVSQRCRGSVAAIQQIDIVWSRAKQERDRKFAEARTLLRGFGDANVKVLLAEHYQTFVSLSPVSLPRALPVQIRKYVSDVVDLTVEGEEDMPSHEHASETSSILTPRTHGPIGDWQVQNAPAHQLFGVIPSQSNSPAPQIQAPAPAPGIEPLGPLSYNQVSQTLPTSKGPEDNMSTDDEPPSKRSK